MTYKLLIPPNDQGYSAQLPMKDVVRVPLPGGFSRSYADLEDATWLVSASWVLDDAELAYFMAVMRQYAKKGATQILIDLALDAPTPDVISEYACNILPGSLNLQGRDGTLAVIGAQLEVTPSQIDPATDLLTIAAYFDVDVVAPDQLKLLAVDMNDSGYASQSSADEVVSSKLDGAAGLYAVGIDNGVIMINAGWLLTGAEFCYFMAYFRVVTDRGATPSNMNVILDGYDYGARLTKFVPGSLSIQSKDGDLYQIGAQVEVAPIRTDSVFDMAVIADFQPEGI